MTSQGHRWLVFWILGIQYMLVYFQRVCPAVLARELMDTFKISATSMGILSSTYFYTYGLMQLPVGFLSDSWGARKTLTLFGLLAGLGSVLFGLSLNFTSAVLNRTLIGFGVSAVFVSTMRILGDYFRPDEIGRISGILMTLGGLGWLLATFPLAYFIEKMGFKATFVFAGLITLLLTLVGYLLMGGPQQKQKKGASYPLRTLRSQLGRILKDRHFLSIGVWFLMRGGALFGFFGLWAGPYLRETYSLSARDSGNILSMIALAMVTTGPIMGHISDRVLKSRKKVLVYTSILNSLCWLTLLLFYEHLNMVALFFIFFLMGTTVSSVGTIAIVSTREHFPYEISGLSMGTMNMFPFLGGIIFQPLLGYILDIAKASQASLMEPYEWILLVLFVGSLISLTSILFCEETLKG